MLVPDNKLPFIDVAGHARIVGSVGRRSVPHLFPSVLSSLLVHVVLAMIAGSGTSLTFSPPPVEEGSASIQCVASLSSMSVSMEPTTLVERHTIKSVHFSPEPMRLDSLLTRPKSQAEIFSTKSLQNPRPSQTVLATLPNNEAMDLATEVKSGSRKATTKSETIRQQSQSRRRKSTAVDEQESETKSAAKQLGPAVSAPPPQSSDPPRPQKNSKSEQQATLAKTKPKQNSEKAHATTAQIQERPINDNPRKPPLQRPDDLNRSIRRTSLLKTERLDNKRPEAVQNTSASINSNAASGSEVDQLPRKLATNAAPPYPAEAILARQQGRVILRVEIAVDGRVLSVHVHRSSNVPSLDQAARNTVRHWRFEPARTNGKAVPFAIAVPVRFQLGLRD